MTAARDPHLPDEHGGTGFSASLAGASIADLVQMQCLSGAECAVRVTSRDDVGYLYIRGGRVVHAVSASNSAEAAALEILGWTSGNFEICNAGWPDVDSILVPVQSLLLRIAQARDESKRHNLVQFRRSPPEPGPRPLDDGSKVAARGAEGIRDTREPSVASSSLGRRLRAAVRLDAAGGTMSSHGASSEDLAAGTALATRLAHLIGSGLGLEGLSAIEAFGPEHRTLIMIEKSGTLIGLSATADADLSSLRERHGVW